MIDFLKRQVGKPYVFGVENDPKEIIWDKYKAWDCSELVEIAYAKIGLQVPDGSYNQVKICNKISGQPLIGDMGFKWHPDTEVVHHVGIYIGNDQVIEAKGKKWGVVLTPVVQFITSPDWAYWGRLKTVEDA
jgi:cell wall-associated NlpC family hydrolase